MFVFVNLCRRCDFKAYIIYDTLDTRGLINGIQSLKLGIFLGNSADTNVMHWLICTAQFFNVSKQKSIKINIL